MRLPQLLSEGHEWSRMARCDASSASNPPGAKGVTFGALEILAPSPAPRSLQVLLPSWVCLALLLGDGRLQRYSSEGAWPLPFSPPAPGASASSPSVPNPPGMRRG